MEELISGQSDVVGRLAFKYMEMCKVDSSSDFDSDTNPRWSDVSQGCESSALETRDAPNKLQRNYTQSLDPYDGSSEGSGSSDDGSGPRGSGRRSANPPRRAGARPDRPDVQMRSSSDSELDTRDKDCCSVNLSDSGFNTRSGLSSPLLPPGSPHSPATHTLPKRKFLPPAGELEDGMRRKRQCITDMEV